MIKLLQAEVDYINDTIKNPKYVKASIPKNRGGKTYLLSNNSPLVDVVAELRGYVDKTIKRGNKEYKYTAKEQCLDEDLYGNI